MRRNTVHHIYEPKVFEPRTRERSGWFEISLSEEERVIVFFAHPDHMRVLADKLRAVADEWDLARTPES